MFQKLCHKNIQLSRVSCCLSPTTVSRYFTKWQGQRVLFPFFKPTHWILQCTYIINFLFRNLTMKINQQRLPDSASKFDLRVSWTRPEPEKVRKSQTFDSGSGGTCTTLEKVDLRVAKSWCITLLQFGSTPESQKIDSKSQTESDLSGTSTRQGCPPSYNHSWKDTDQGYTIDWPWNKTRISFWGNSTLKWNNWSHETVKFSLHFAVQHQENATHDFGTFST